MVPSCGGSHELGAGGSDKTGEGDTNLGPWGCQRFYCWACLILSVELEGSFSKWPLLFWAISVVKKWSF